MFSRSFTTSARRLVQYLGFNKEELKPGWKNALDRIEQPGSAAEAKLGTLQEIDIKERDGNPYYQSSFNTEDKSICVSVTLVGSKMRKVAHLFRDGTYTLSKKGPRH